MTKLDNVYISSFCMELYLVLQAGMPIATGIGMLLEDNENNLNKDVLKSIHEKMENGAQLSTAIKESTGFPDYVPKMLEIGEQTGNLDSCLKSLSAYYSRKEQIFLSIKSTIAYPAILTFMMLFVIIIIITKVLPIFSNIFAQLGSTMSPFATIILDIGQAVNNHFIVSMVLLVALVCTFFYFFMAKSGQEKLATMFEKGKIGESIALANFASAMSMAMQSGLDADDSLAMAKALCTETTINNKIQDCQTRIKEGEAFYSAMLNASLFPSIYCQMLNIGFKTGSADVVMEELAKRTEYDATTRIEQAIGRIEPTLVIIMSVIVGLILISVMLPLTSIMSAIG